MDECGDGNEQNTNLTFIDRTETRIPCVQPLKIQYVEEIDTEEETEDTYSDITGAETDTDNNRNCRHNNNNSNSNTMERHGGNHDDGQVAPLSPSSPTMRSELNVEVKGIREGRLTSTPSKVVSSTVRTVYGRSLSGSTSSADGDNDASASLNSPTGSNEKDAPPVFEERQHEDAAQRTPTEVKDGGIWASHRKTSESHYISQTYELSKSMDSPNKSVTAIQNVTFRCHKELDLNPAQPYIIPSSPTSPGAAAANTCGSVDSCFDNDNENNQCNQSPAYECRFIDRLEQIMTIDEPKVLGSPKLDVCAAASNRKLQKARKDVQQMIETSYMVSDISDVIDDHSMNQPPPVTESSVDQDSSNRPAPSSKKNDNKREAEKSHNNTVTSTQEKQEKNSVRPPATLNLDKDSPKRLAYSPGFAIRSYALEELAEKQLKRSPDGGSENSNSPDIAPSSSESTTSQMPNDNDDIGSSVDQDTHRQTVFQATESSQSHLYPNVSSTTAACPMTEEELLESEDTLESLVDITAGYRFHDVGMMLDLDDGGGICNPAFDDEAMYDDEDNDNVDADVDGVGHPSLYQQEQQDRFASQDHTMSTLESQDARTVLASTNAAPLMAMSSPTLQTAPPPLKAADLKRKDSQTENRHNELKPEAVDLSSTTPTSLPSLSSTINHAALTCAPGLSHATPISQPETSCNSSAVNKSPKKPKSQKVGPPVTVTRHFNVTKKFESSLKSMGARLTAESLFIDVYYDTPSYDLTRADSWLRTHNGKWQFHANFCTMYEDCDKFRYSETEDARAILSDVASALNQSSTSKPNSSVTSLVQKSGLQEFVRHTTKTKTYRLGESMTVEIVMPEYGFWTGSVTSTASCKAQTHLAVKDIDDLWNKTGQC